MTNFLNRRVTNQRTEELSFFIDSYRFGNITINGTSYQKDVLILNDRVIHPWWRKQGHLLQAVDLQSIAGQPAQVLVVGTGAYGVMTVSNDTYDFVQKLGLTMQVQKTDQAVEIFNNLQKAGTPAIAGFHLTC